MGCTDPVTKELNRRGYNLVRLPRIGINPLDVLGRDSGNLEKLGSIDEVWTSTETKPLPGDPAPAAGIDGESTSDLDLGIGLKLLSNALAGLGSSIGLPSLNLAFKTARTIQFKFVNVESVSITPFALGNFLKVGKLDQKNPFVSHFFGNDDTQEYVIFDILRSDSVSVSAKSDSGGSVEPELNVLSGMLTANVKVKADASNTTELVFRSQVKATFAFKAFEIFLQTGNGSFRQPARMTTSPLPSRADRRAILRQCFSTAAVPFAFVSV